MVGASVRGSLAMVRTAKVWAASEGRGVRHPRRHQAARRAGARPPADPGRRGRVRGRDRASDRRAGCSPTIDAAGHPGLSGAVMRLRALRLRARRLRALLRPLRAVSGLGWAVLGVGLVLGVGGWWLGWVEADGPGRVHGGGRRARRGVHRRALDLRRRARRRRPPGHGGRAGLRPDRGAQHCARPPAPGAAGAAGRAAGGRLPAALAASRRRGTRSCSRSLPCAARSSRWARCAPCAGTRWG